MRSGTEKKLVSFDLMAIDKEEMKEVALSFINFKIVCVCHKIK